MNFNPCGYLQYRDSEVKSLWPKLRGKIPSLFEGLSIEPALLHGDMWSGNVGEDEEGPGILHLLAHVDVAWLTCRQDYV